MKNFKDLNKNMRDVIEKILSSQNLCKYIYYTQTNPLSQSDIESTLILTDNKNIIPRCNSSEITTDEKVQLYVYLDFFKNNGKYYIANNLIIDIYIHENLTILTGDDFIRTYCIMHELDLLFKGQKVAGLGKLEFNYAQILDDVVNHDVVRMVYNITDFA